MAGKLNKYFKNTDLKVRQKNKIVTKARSKSPRARELQHQKMLATIKNSVPSTALNLDFYRSAEGLYNSYWLGKFINTLQLGGNKKTVTQQVYRAFSQFRYGNRGNPLLVFLEILDRIKPTFRLRNYIVRRVIIKEYPIVVLQPRRLILAVHWLKEEVRAGSDRFSTSLAEKISNQLLEFASASKKSVLVKKRTEYIRRTVKAQFNIRYTFR